MPVNTVNTAMPVKPVKAFERNMHMRIDEFVEGWQAIPPDKREAALMGIQVFARYALEDLSARADDTEHDAQTFLALMDKRREQKESSMIDWEETWAWAKLEYEACNAKTFAYVKSKALISDALDLAETHLQHNEDTK